MEEKLADKSAEFNTLAQRINNLEKGSYDYDDLEQENEYLAASNDRLKEENTALREQNKDYTLLRKVFGSQQNDDLIKRAKEAQQVQKRQCQKSRGWER